MYVPAHFEETRPDLLHELIRQHPLAVLVTPTASGVDANHLPMEVDPEPAPFGTLRGHVARANPVWRQVVPGAECLAIFRGPDAYVSPAWYPTKEATGKVVPTWNYAVVHAHGPVRVIDDATWLRRLVERLTDRFERDRADRWHVSDAPADYVDAMVRAIVGIELPIVRLIGKWKVSQNRPPADREGVARGLDALGDPTSARLAALVREG